MLFIMSDMRLSCRPLCLGRPETRRRQAEAYRTLKHHSSEVGLLRSRLTSDRRFLFSSIRVFTARGPFVGLRFLGRRFIRVIFSRSFCRHSALFRCWLRSSCELTT